MIKTNVGNSFTTIDGHIRNIAQLGLFSSGFLKDFNRVGWGKMSMVWESRSLKIFICMPGIRESMVIGSTFSLSSDPIEIERVKLMTL